MLSQAASGAPSGRAVTLEKNKLHNKSFQNIFIFNKSDGNGILAVCSKISICIDKVFVLPHAAKSITAKGLGN